MERNDPCNLCPLSRQGTPEAGMNTRTCLHIQDGTIILDTVGILKGSSDLESGGYKRGRILGGKSSKDGQNFLGDIYSQDGY